MAASSPYAATPSMRGVRDKYLDILLTGGKQPPTTPAPSPNPPPLWTPGKHLPTAQNMNVWTSPVTPTVPSEHDVRLAEIAAGLVAAGGVEHRQTDTIRRLAEQLERSEKKVRDLEHDTRRRSSGRRRKTHELLEDEDRTQTRRRSRNDIQRHIRFTPAKQDEEIEDLQYRRESRTPTARTPKRSSVEKKLIAELHNLKKEKDTWRKEKLRSKEEAEKLSRMLVDIRRNTQRLLTERDEHLKTISTLQEEVQRQRRTAELLSACTDERVSSRRRNSPPREARHTLTRAHNNERNYSHGRISPTGSISPVREGPIPMQSILEDRMKSGTHDRNPGENFISMHVPGNSFQTPNAPAMGFDQRYVNTDLQEDFCQALDYTGEQRPGEDISGILEQPVEREYALRQELKLVLEENERLTERVPVLEAEVQDLNRRLEETTIRHTIGVQVTNLNDHQAGGEITAPNASAGNQQYAEPAENAQRAVGSGNEEISQELMGLVEELDVLESVCGAVNFGINPSEADELQDTMSTVNITQQEASPRQNVATVGVTSVVLVRNMVNRLTRIRTGLSVRYGQWLQAVANDVDSSSILISNPSITTLDAALEGTMDSEVIDGILRGTS